MESKDVFSSKVTSTLGIFFYKSKWNWDSKVERFHWFLYLFSAATDMLNTVAFRHFFLHFRQERTLHPPWSFLQTVTGPRCSARPVGLSNKRLCCWQRPKYQPQMELGPDSRPLQGFFDNPRMSNNTWLSHFRSWKICRNIRKAEILLCFAFALAQWGSALSISSLHGETAKRLPKPPFISLFSKIHLVTLSIMRNNVAFHKVSKNAKDYLTFWTFSNFSSNPHVCLHFSL